MNVMVVGGGGREHAITWKLVQDPAVEIVLCAPGNAGTAREQRCRNSGATSITDIVAAAFAEKIAIAIIGPEGPLVDGLADALRDAGIPAIGPGASAARLEGSKAFAKAFMRRHGVKTAAFEVFDDARAAEAYVTAAGRPLVVKADGLAAGKGVIVCDNAAEAREALADLMEGGSLGGAGRRVVIEERLNGVEASVIAATDGKVIVPFISCKDHKRALDSDRGPNTGGMGVIAPNPAYGSAEEAAFRHDILEPTLRGMKAEGLAYPGFLFFGLMMTKDGVFNLEYNARLGDPETEALLPLMTSGFLPLCEAMLEGRLADFRLEWHPGAACTVIGASGGYPGAFKTGYAIEGYGSTESKVFLAGAREEGGRIVTAGGRVYAITGLGGDLAKAREAAYRDLKSIGFTGMHYRKDIGT